MCILLSQSVQGIKVVLNCFNKWWHFIRLISFSFNYLYSDDEIVNISKYKFILTILHILFLFEYQIPRCIYLK